MAKKFWKHAESWKSPPPANNALYGLGMVGALVYYLGHASSFGDGVVGVFKALLWPGFVVHRLMDFLKL